jgi:hypothetical protein
MSNLLLSIILTSLFVNGLQIATSDGMLLHFVKKRLDKIFITQKILQRQPIVSKWYYPILHCVKCMPSIYGTIICLLLLPHSAVLLWQIPLVILCSVCLATVINSNYI